MTMNEARCKNCGAAVCFSSSPHVCIKTDLDIAVEKEKLKVIKFERKEDKIKECMEYLQSKGFTPEDYKNNFEND